MANLTIAVEDSVLRLARIRALESGTSVNALLRYYLESYVGDDAMARRRALAENARHTVAELGEMNWSRDDLHRC